MKFPLMAPEDDLSGAGGVDTGSAGDTDNGASRAPTMDETARNTYRALMKAAGETVDDDTVDETTEADDEPGEDAEHHSRKQPRNKGKFAKQQQPSEGEDDEPVEDDEGGDDTQQQQQQAQPKPHDAFPNTWRRDLESEWANLPERVREEIHKREQDFHAGVRQYRDAAGFGQSMAQEFLPYQQVIRERGLTPQGIVRDILRSLNTLVTGSEEAKTQEFLNLANAYGINLDNVMSLRQRAPSQAEVDLTPVLQRVDAIEARFTQAEQERERLQREEDEANVNAFLSDPKRPHAKAVSREMASLLLSGQARNLEEAYEKAIWIHPEVRQKLLQQQEKERQKREAEEAAAAKKAAAANVNRRGSHPAPAKRGTMEDTARAVYRKLVPSP